ncbi:MAG: hypothetical protein AB1Z66_03085 [Candidatus Limnocylindrales bacterium]
MTTPELPPSDASPGAERSPLPDSSPEPAPPSSSRSEPDAEPGSGSSGGLLRPQGCAEWTVVILGVIWVVLGIVFVVALVIRLDG